MTSAQLAYAADRTLLGPVLGPSFRELACDAATDAWLAREGAQPHGWWTSTLVSVLTRFESLYDAHGRLGAYAMHLLSEAQWRVLLGPEPCAALLDVGAGAGYITSEARALFAEVVCTETSAQLRKRLRQRGFDARDTDLSRATLGRQFPVVACLNVLDRTPRPRALLAALRAHLAPGGQLVIALPLPLSPHVHVAGGTISAEERLPITARGFEQAARQLTDALFAPAGLVPRSFSRVPYLSRGDAGAPFYVLDAGVWVLTAAP